MAVALEDDLYIGKIKKVYKKKVTVFYIKKVREDTVFVIDANFQIVMKSTPGFRFEIPSLPEIVKHYKAYHKHYFTEN